MVVPTVPPCIESEEHESMGKQRLPYNLLACGSFLFMVNGVLADKQENMAKQGEETSKSLPSREWLEFFAEFNDVDDEEFEIILHHSLRDAESGEEDIDHE